VELLGTAGGIRRAAPLLGEGDVLVWNGDILADVDLDALAHAHGGGADATLVVKPREGDRGNIGIDARGAVVRMRRETAKPGEVRSADFMGIHIVGAALRARMPEVGDSVGDVYLPALRERARIGVVDYELPFWDIGTIASYVDANLAWLEARGARAWSAPSATIDAGVVLDRTVVGEGASVSGEGTLARCVVWPGARAVAPLEDAVITPFGTAQARD
jgi:mannose-1-phosphate guanylyltransferase